MAEIKLQIPLDMERNGWRLKDAIYLTQEEIDNLGDEGIEQLKQQRFDEWYYVVTAPPVEIPIEDQINEIEAQIETLESQKAELLAQLGGE